MLRWLIAEWREDIAKTTRAINSATDPFPLPKSGHGLPEQWVHGSKTGTEVDRENALRSLRAAERFVARSDVARGQGNLPKALYLLDAAGRSWHAAVAIWQGGGTVRIWRYVKSRRQVNAENAGQPRKRISPKKPLTARRILSYKNAFIKKNKQERGWMKAAVLHFGADPKTIRSRLNRKGD